MTVRWFIVGLACLMTIPAWGAHSLPVMESGEIAVVFSALESQDPQVAQAAQSRLRKMWQELWSEDITPHLPVFGELLLHDRQVVRRYAALTVAGAAANHPASAASLSKIGSELITALGDPDPEVRQAVATALTFIRPSPPLEAAGPLMHIVRDDENAQTRDAALTALLRIRPAPGGLREIMVSEVREQGDLEVQALEALGGYEIEPGMVELVTDRLDSPEIALRFAAVKTLLRWGDGASGALPKLREVAASGREPEYVRELAARAVERMTPREAGP